jgi:hypothetical protein
MYALRIGIADFFWRSQGECESFCYDWQSVNGQATERRLREYLNMVSLSQTCRYRNISFLDFLRGEVGLG